MANQEDVEKGIERIERDAEIVRELEEAGIENPSGNLGDYYDRDGNIREKGVEFKVVCVRCGARWNCEYSNQTDELIMGIYCDCKSPLLNVTPKDSDEYYRFRGWFGGSNFREKESGKE